MSSVSETITQALARFGTLSTGDSRALLSAAEKEREGLFQKLGAAAELKSVAAGAGLDAARLCSDAAAVLGLCGLLRLRYGQLQETSARLFLNEQTRTYVEVDLWGGEQASRALLLDLIQELSETAGKTHGLSSFKARLEALLGALRNQTLRAGMELASLGSAQEAAPIIEWACARLDGSLAGAVKGSILRELSAA